MTESLIREIITDYENMKNIISKRLQKLYNLLGENYNPNETMQLDIYKKENTNTNLIKDEIRKRNYEIQDKIKKLRLEVIEKANLGLDKLPHNIELNNNFGIQDEKKNW